MKKPKVLVISHNCFSDSGSNGRTLANFFEGYPSEKLAQFYIYNETPSVATCDNYYRITDADAVKSVFSNKYGGMIGRLQAHDSAQIARSATPKLRKTSLVYCIRELVWKMGHWDNKRLKRWIEDFAPEVVLFQAGDAAFLFDFARRISQKRNIPLVIYNSENYYFKSHNYLTAAAEADLGYRILHGYFRRHAAKAIRHASCSVYISDMLREIYDAKFHVPSVTIMTSTKLLESEKVIKEEKTQISYLGNLGVGRHETLMELASILQSVDPMCEICVYGKAEPTIVQMLDNAPGIRYCGFVSYNECVEIMKSSMMLIHVENFSDFYQMDSKYAFSTKIADSLACGTCLFVYAPRELSCAKYLSGNGAACVASDPDEARTKLELLLRSRESREKLERKAVEIAAENHSVERNRQRFLDVIQQL